MSSPRSRSLALVLPGAGADDPSLAAAARAGRRERRAFTRVSPLDLKEPLTARLKYGEAVTLVDVSPGGALFETPNRLRPEADLVLEVSGPRDAPVHVVSRVLRCEVVGLRGGVVYRGACAFKRPLAHPSLAAAEAPPDTAPGDFLKLEFALKTIVESYLRSQAVSAGAPAKDASTLLMALDRLRAAAERRDDPNDRRLAELLTAILPALEQSDAREAVSLHVIDQLRRHVPLLALRGGSAPDALAADRERLTFELLPGVASDGGAVMAEFQHGFGLDEPQFRLLKAGAYLIGLAERWMPSPPPPPPPMGKVPFETPALSPQPPQTPAGVSELPEGWQRVVVRFVDGKLLRGFSNDFHPDRAHLHLCPSVGCPAGERLLVPIARLKAVFFVRDHHGNAERVDTQEFDHDPRARKLEVTFRDGEVLAGSTLSYKPHGQGFFLKPANSGGNNLRVYVVNAAMLHMRFL